MHEPYIHVNLQVSVGRQDRMMHDREAWVIASFHRPVFDRAAAGFSSSTCIASSIAPVACRGLELDWTHRKLEIEQCDAHACVGGLALHR